MRYPRDHASRFMKAGVLFRVPELSWRKWRKLAGKNKEDADSSKNRKCGGRRFIIMVATQNKCLVTALRGRCVAPFSESEGDCPEPKVAVLIG